MERAKPRDDDLMACHDRTTPKASIGGEVDRAGLRRTTGTTHETQPAAARSVPRVGTDKIDEDAHAEGRGRADPNSRSTAG